jgi:hypothetical protein
MHWQDQPILPWIAEQKCTARLQMPSLARAAARCAPRPLSWCNACAPLPRAGPSSRCSQCLQARSSAVEALPATPPPPRSRAAASGTSRSSSARRARPRLTTPRPSSTTSRQRASRCSCGWASRGSTTGVRAAPCGHCGALVATGTWDGARSGWRRAHHDCDLAAPVHAESVQRKRREAKQAS